MIASDFQRPMFWFSFACFVASSSIVIWASNRGFSYSDDAFYLVWASIPFAYKYSTSQFGYVWHPLYELAGGDIGLFRLGGMVVLGLCALLFGWALCRFLDERLRDSHAKTVILLGVVAGAFWALKSWRPTPNYDQLNLCGLLLVLSGLLLATRVSLDARSARDAILRNAILPAALVGFGLAIEALAKPTSGLAAIALGIVWLLALRPKHSLLCLGVAVLSSAVTLATAALLIDGNIAVFIERNATGLDIALNRSAGQDRQWIVTSIVRPFLTPDSKIAAGVQFFGFTVVIVSLALAWIAILLRGAERFGFLLRAVIIGIPAIIALLIAYYYALGPEGPGIGLRAYQAAQVSFVVILIVLAVFVLPPAWRRAEPGTARILWAAGLIALGPFVYAIGTGSSIVFFVGYAGVLWVAAIILVAAAAPAPRRRLLIDSVGMLSCMSALAIIVGMMASPFRMAAPIWEQTEPVALNGGRSVLLVGAETGSYLRALQSAAAKAGFETGTPVLDFSDSGPGAIFALGGVPPGATWLTDNTLKSPAFPRAALATVAASELRRAWVITARGENSPMARAVLEPFGLDFPQDYSPVGDAELPALALAHTLWKPRAP